MNWIKMTLCESYGGNEHGEHFRGSIQDDNNGIDEPQGCGWSSSSLYGGPSIAGSQNGWYTEVPVAQTYHLGVMSA